MRLRNSMIRIWMDVAFAWLRTSAVAVVDVVDVRDHHQAAADLAVVVVQGNYHLSFEKVVFWNSNENFFVNGSISDHVHVATRAAAQSHAEVVRSHQLKRSESRVRNLAITPINHAQEATTQTAAEAREATRPATEVAAELRTVPREADRDHGKVLRPQFVDRIVKEKT